MGSEWFGVRRIPMALVVSALLMAVAMAGLGAVAVPAAANDISCARSGSTLSWTPTNQTIQVRGFDAANGDASTWLAGVGGAENSYRVSDVDRSNAPGDRFFIRYRNSGDVFETPCNEGDEPPTTSITCVENGTELSWSQLDVSRNVFFVRQVEADASTSYVATVDASDNNTFSPVSADTSYIIRYRVTSSPGNTAVFDEPCTTNGTPPPQQDIECDIDPFGFQTEVGYYVTIEGAAPNESFTLFINGVIEAEASEPFEVDDVTGVGENTYFGVDSFGQSRDEVEVARTNELDTKFSCGSFGMGPSPVVNCAADDAFAGEVELVLMPELLADFEVTVNGVLTDVQPNRPDFPINALPFSYSVEADQGDTIVIVQEAGNVNCTGNEAATFCQKNTSGVLEWKDAGDITRGEYHVRRINTDGSNTYVLTTTALTTGDSVGEGEFLIRFRASADGAVTDEVCTGQ